MNALKRLQIFERLAQDNPEPTTELHFQTPYELLVAVVLSAQSTDVGVNKATIKLFAEANSPKAMLALGEKKIKKHIQTLGLFNNKAQYLLGLSQKILNDYGGEVPRKREELETLPGVGRKTANVILNTLFNQPTIAVDTHIFRVANRTKIATGKNVMEVEVHLNRSTPHAYKMGAHHWLILHGRYVCKARKPQCGRCIIEDLCEYDQKVDE